MEGNGIEIKGIIWVGSATDEIEATAAFFSNTLGMELVTDLRGYKRLAASNGDRIELFGPRTAEYSHLTTGPVAGLWVENAAAAHSELAGSGEVEVTDLETGPDGHQWFYLRAPDGNYYEVCEHPGPRRPRSPSADAG